MQKTGDPKGWIAKAEADFEAAKTLIRSRKRGMFDIVCYHSQQCAEKYLKAYLTYRRIKFPKTHDLEKLLDLIIVFDPLCASERESALFLNPYSITIRYPGDEASREEAKKALKVLSSFRTFFQDRIGLHPTV